jgi:hypothetical protein
MSLPLLCVGGCDTQAAGPEYSISTGTYWQRFAFDQLDRIVNLNVGTMSCLDVADNTARLQTCSSSTSQQWKNLRE